MAVNDITGDKLISKISTPAYEAGYEKIFSKQKVALLDGDIFCYRAGYSVEKDGEPQEPLGIAISRMDTAIWACLEEVEAKGWQIFLTASNNFRKEVYPGYKANRTQAKPVYLDDLRNHIITKYGGAIADGMEADDYLAIYHVLNPDHTVICTIDKDLKQVAGNHYNFVKKEFAVVTELEGLRTFYTQFLVGDAADNIIGIAGLGPVKAGKLLASCETEQEMFDIVRFKYDDDTRMRMNGICLWMKRTLDDDWGIHFDNLIGRVDE